MKRVLFWAATLLVVFTFVSPLVWIYLTSLKTNADIYTQDLVRMFFFSPILDNYINLFTKTVFVRELLNTLIISISSTFLVMLVALPAAYSFARYETGHGHLLFVTISTRMFPAAVAAIPFFMAMKGLGLLDTRFCLVILYLYFNVSFAVFLLYGFFREIPVELEQAATIDGYGRIDIFRKIIFPMIMPGAAITAMFCFIFSWNEFLYAFLFTRNIARTVTIGLASFWASGQVDWGTMAACICVAILPTLAAAWFMQRYIIRGLSFGAVKG